MSTEAIHVGGVLVSASKVGSEVMVSQSQSRATARFQLTSLNLVPQPAICIKLL